MSDEKGSNMILIIDDEEMILKLTSRFLIKSGFRVEKFLNSLDAIEYYKNNFSDVHLVLLDMRMPEMPGAIIYEKLQEINPGIRCILNSGFSVEGDAVELLSRDHTVFIQKPYEFKTLITLINDLLSM